MALTATIHRTARGYERQLVDLNGTLRDRDSVAFDVVLEDLSFTGFRVQLGPSLNVGDRISLGLAGMGMRTVTVMRRSDEGYGCQFDIALSPTELAAVLAMPVLRPIPFPSIYPSFTYPEATRSFAPPHIKRYSRRVRLIGGLALAAASWALIGLAIAAVL